MLQVEIATSKAARFDTNHLNAEVSALADKVAGTMTNYAKLSLISFGKVASGGTLRATTWRDAGGRNNAIFGVAATGLQRRQIVSGMGWFFITSGRRAGAKMPIRLIGTGPRGGKVFEPLPALVRWFTALNIDKTAWFPILRAIKVRGIKPIPLARRAIQMGMPAVQSDVRVAAMRISQGLIKTDAV